MEFMSNTFEILRRELRSYFGSPVAYVFLVAFLVLTGVFTFLISHYYEVGQADLKSSFFFWHPWVYLLLVPAAAMRLWAEERRAGTIELLFTLPVTMPQAVLGKFLAAWLFLALALVLTCPVVFTSVWLGNPDMGAVVAGYVGSLLVAGTYLSVGLWSSAITKNQVISFVVSLSICLVLVLIGFGMFSDMLYKWAPAWLVDGLALVGVWPHYESIQTGVIDIRDITYYLSVIVVMLLATHLTLENRRMA